MSITVISPPPKERGSGEKGGSIYQLLRASCRSQTTQVPRIIARGGGGRSRPVLVLTRQDVKNSAAFFL